MEKLPSSYDEDPQKSAPYYIGKKEIIESLLSLWSSMSTQK
jgi:hypothetical protein